jgi:hypothetical protein
LVALIGGSFAGVIEFIMFNRPTSTHSGHLLPVAEIARKNARAWQEIAEKFDI